MTIWYSLSLSWFLINIQLERLGWKWIYNKGICIFLLRAIPLLMLELMNRMYRLKGKNISFCLSSHCGTLLLVPCESMSFSFKHSIVNQVFLKLQNLENPEKFKNQVYSKLLLVKMLCNYLCTLSEIICGKIQFTKNRIDTWLLTDTR